MRTIHRDIVAAMIFSKDGKLFLGKKHAERGGVYVDCWHIPGGGVDDGESLEVALQREIKEETGIDISRYLIELIDDKGNGESEKILKDTGEKVMCQMHFTVYKVIVDDKSADEIELRLDDDLERAEWVSTEELNNIKLTPPSVELFKRLKIL